MKREQLPEKWKCPYMSHETDTTFKQLHLKKAEIRPKSSSGRRNTADPWNRLHYRPTVSALMRLHSTESRSKDSLDLCLGSTCDQLMDWPISKSDAVRQKETAEKRCFCRPISAAQIGPFDHPLRLAPLGEMHIDLNYVKLAVDCPHTSQTNNGYSRNDENGNFYRS